MRILVIEDEPALARHIARALAREGHEPDVCHDGESGLLAAQRNAPDLLVLDLNLPALDGLSLLARFRGAGGSARVLVLTARAEVDDRVKGLTAGADDYLTKPFAMAELIARVEALGRRGGAPAPEDRLRVADLQLDVHSRKVARAGRTIALSPREFDLLQVLMQEPGRVFSRTELCERVWQRSHEYETRTVEIFIARLRKKIDVGGTPLIHTVRSAGYSVHAA